MGDLISRAAARNVINTWGQHENEDVRMDLLHNDLNAIPAIDAVPVVRCKECVFWLRGKGYGPNGECGCRCNGGWWLPEDYCSCGERREEDDG